MNREYIKEIKIEDKNDEIKDVELITSIINTKKELEVSIRNFDYAQGDLIDYYIYKIKACRSKFDYLLKLAKQKGLSLEIIEQIEISYNEVI